MTVPVIVLGAGGHAKVVIDALLAGGAQVQGIVERDASLLGRNIFGVPVIGGDEMVLSYPVDRVLLCCGVGSVRQPQRRRAVFERFRARGYRFVTVVHPRAIVGRGVDIGEGAQIMAGAVIQPGARIGMNVIVNTGASVDHDCRIGDHVHLAPGVTLSGEVEVGDGTHIGTGATVIQGIRIGSECLVGAGTLVIRDVADAETVIGVPAKVITR